MSKQSSDTDTVVVFIRGCPSVWDREEVYYKFRKMLEDEPDSIDRDMAVLDFEDALEDREKIIEIGSKMHDEKGEYELNSLIDKLSFKKKNG